MFKIAIVGKSNVGKTTIFNKIIGRKIAITDNQPGVTIDRKSKTITWRKMRFELCDTAGLENCRSDDEIKQKAQSQSLMALEEADLCIFTIDGKDYADDIDFFLAKLLTEKGKNIILLVNKAENINNVVLDPKIMRYKWATDPVFFSAEHNIGFDDLKDQIKPFYERYSKVINQEFEKENNDQRINIAIVGKPNAGKSTLINNILSSDRLVTSAIAGTTRDSITIPFDFNGTKANLIDTAGIRRKIYVEDKLEDESIKESFRAIDFAHVVIFLTDSSAREKIPDQQDKKILAKVAKEGKPIIVVANKWDLVKDKESKINEFANAIKKIGDIKVYGNSFVSMSALNDQKLDQIITLAIEAYNKSSSSFSTNKLNNWLQYEFLPMKKSPFIKGRELKMKFMTQTGQKPLTFKVFCNFAEIPNSYMDFFRSQLSEKFDLQGLPIRVLVKKTDNPYSKKGVKRTNKFQ